MSLSDQEIADALEKAGILLHGGTVGSQEAYWIETPTNHHWWSVEQVLSDWRVAGACLERMPNIGALMTQAEIAHPEAPVILGLSKVLKGPRAICEAFAESQL